MPVILKNVVAAAVFIHLEKAASRDFVLSLGFTWPSLIFVFGPLCQIII